MSHRSSCSVRQTSKSSETPIVFIAAGDADTRAAASAVFIVNGDLHVREVFARAALI